MTRFSNMRRALVPLSLTATVVGVAALGTPAQGNSPAAIGSTAAADSQKVTAATAVDRSCHAKYVGGAAGTQTVTATAPATGLVRARLSGNGDWDLGVFDSSSGRTIAGSAGFGVQRAGGGLRQEGPEAARAGVPLPRQRVERRPVGRLRRDRRALHRQGEDRRRQHAPPARQKQRLQSLGLDLTEHGDANSVEVVLHGAADERKLRDAGFTYDVRIADLEARSKADTAADAKFAASNPKTQLPSGSNAVPPSRRLQPRAQAAGHALPGAREGADAQPPVGRGPRRQRHRDHPEPDRAGRQADLPAARRPPRA